MKRIKISLTRDIFLHAYKDLGIKSVFVYPGYEVDRNIEVTFEPAEAEVTEDVYREISSRAIGGFKIFDVEDLEVAEEKQSVDTANAEEEYKDRQKQRGK